MQANQADGNHQIDIEAKSKQCWWSFTASMTSVIRDGPNCLCTFDVTSCIIKDF